MLYLEDAIYEWLSTASPSTDWKLANQVSAPPKTQSSDSFGYYMIDDLEPQSLGNQKSVYDAGEDKIRTTLQNWYIARVVIDIYSKDTTQDAQDASIIATKVVNYVGSTIIKEYFFARDIGFLKFDSILNISDVESFQVRKRYQIKCLFNIQISDDELNEIIVEAPVDLDIAN